MSTFTKWSMLLACSCAASMVTPGALAQSHPPYRVTEIALMDAEDFPLTDFFTPNVDNNGTIAINNLGEIVYTMKVSGTLNAFIYLPAANYGLSAGLHNLNTLASETGPSIARDITDWGVIVGQFDGVGPGEEGSEAAVWVLDSGAADMQLLGVLDSPQWSGAYAITNEQTEPVITGAAGVIGDCECDENDPEEDNNEVEHAFRVVFDDPLPSITELIPDEEWRNGFGRAIAALSGGGLRIVGDESCGGRLGQAPPGIGKCPPDASCHPFTKGLDWSTGTGAGVLNKVSGGGGFRAYGISEDDELVGSGFDDDAPACIEQAWFWSSASATPCILGNTMPSGQSTHESRAFAINSASGNDMIVVGANVFAARALLWIQDGTGSCPTNWTAIDLDAGQDNWNIVEAHDANDEGVIVGWGSRTDYEDFDVNSRVVMLTPIESCLGDITDAFDGPPDGVIDVFDLLEVLASWGDCQPRVICGADITNSGDDGFDQTVDVFDLLYLLGHWGDCTTQTGNVPKTVEDCFSQFYPDEMEALEACLDAVAELQE